MREEDREIKAQQSNNRDSVRISIILNIANQLNITIFTLSMKM